MTEDKRTVSEIYADRLSRFYNGKTVTGFLMPDHFEFTIVMSDGSKLIVSSKTRLDLSVLGHEDVPD